ARIEVARRILDLQKELRNLVVEITRKRIEERGTAVPNGVTATLSLRHAELFDAMPCACMTFDAAGHIKEFNRACFEMFGVAEGEAGDLNYWDIVRDREDHQSDRAA